jgi:hypothetical protein
MPVAVVDKIWEVAPDFFVINMTTAALINETQIGIQYRGKSNPPLTCDLTVSEYSLNSIVWYPMSLTGDSDVQDLNLIPSWISFNLTWDAWVDIQGKVMDPEEGMYNRNIWIRFRATSGSKETFLISYRVYYKNPVYPVSKDSTNDHIDMYGSSLMEQAPEVY